jgi:cell volume regulation protein A
VVLSVVLQGGSVPLLARWLHVRMRDVEQEPFSLGVRLREEPQGAYRLGVAAGSLADGCRVEQVPGMGEGTWVTLLVRDHALLPVRGDTVLRAGDEVLLLVDEEQDAGAVCAVFSDPA